MGAAGYARHGGLDDNHRLWLHDIDRGLNRKTATDGVDGAANVDWSR